MDAGLLLVRLVFGVVMAAHGSQKLFGWFGGHGLRAVTGMFESLGFRPGGFFAPLAAFAELVSGLLVAVGLLGPIGPAVMLSVMIVAAVSVHWPNGLFAMWNGIELPLLYPQLRSDSSTITASIRATSTKFELAAQQGGPQASHRRIANTLRPMTATR